MFGVYRVCKNKLNGILSKLIVYYAAVL